VEALAVDHKCPLRDLMDKIVERQPEGCFTKTLRGINGSGQTITGLMGTNTGVNLLAPVLNRKKCHVSNVPGQR